MPLTADLVMAGLDPATHALKLPQWLAAGYTSPNGTLYVGVTSNLARRFHEHREGTIPGFTKQYGLKRLIYAEQHDTIQSAIQREKNIKHWSRAWKVRLILETNPSWGDLTPTPQ